MKIMIKSVILFLFVVQLFGCGNVNFEDTSHHQEYAHLIGNTFKTINQSKIIGYSLNNEKVIHKYAITNLGAEGRYIFLHRTLPSNTRIKVKKVMTCTNCILDFDPRIRYVVDIIPVPSYILTDKEIWMDDDVPITRD